MKIVVTGATGKMGLGLIPILRSRGHEVTAFVRKTEVDADSVVENWMTNSRAREAVRGADSIVNLAGNGNPPKGETYEQANVEPARVIQKLLDGRKAPHLVFISYPGVSEDSRSQYLAAKALGEAVSKGSAERAAILRTSFLCGTRVAPLESDKSLLASKGKKVPMFGDGLTRFRPILLDDAVNAIAGVVEARAEGDFALEGPNTLSIVELVKILNGRDVGFQKLPGWLSLMIGPWMGMRRDFVRFFLADALEGAPNVSSTLSIPLHSVQSAWPPLA